jgi:membrane protein CcdC involved in cytochrome C biogenesis
MIAAQQLCTPRIFVSQGFATYTFPFLRLTSNDVNRVEASQALHTITLVASAPTEHRLSRWR